MLTARDEEIFIKSIQMLIKEICGTGFDYIIVILANYKAKERLVYYRNTFKNYSIK